MTQLHPACKYSTGAVLDKGFLVCQYLHRECLFHLNSQPARCRIGARNGVVSQKLLFSCLQWRARGRAGVLTGEEGTLARVALVELLRQEVAQSPVASTDLEDGVVPRTRAAPEMCGEGLDEVDREDLIHARPEELARDKAPPYGADRAGARHLAARAKHEAPGAPASL